MNLTSLVHLSAPVIHYLGQGGHVFVLVCFVVVCLSIVMFTKKLWMNFS